MLALTPVKSFKPYPSAVMMSTSFTIDRGLKNHVIVQKLSEPIIKISKSILNDLYRIQPKVNLVAEMGSYINDLEPEIIYEHAIKMSESENPRIRKLSVCLHVEAAKRGSLKSLNKVASLLLNDSSELSQDGECPKKRGIKFFKEAAKHDSAEALMNLGHHHLKGNGVKQNLDKATAYYLKADEMGDDYAFSHVNFIKKELMPYPDPKQAALDLTLVRKPPQLSNNSWE